MIELTEREQDVLQAIREGHHSASSIARHLEISIWTARDHLAAIASKIPDDVSSKPMIRVVIFARDSSPP